MFFNNELNINRKHAEDPQMLSPTNYANKGKDKMGTLKNIAKGFVKDVLNTKEEEKKCSGAAEILIKVINIKATKVEKY
jgi:hypothetical protein